MKDLLSVSFLPLGLSLSPSLSISLLHSLSKVLVPSKYMIAINLKESKMHFQKTLICDKP